MESLHKDPVAVEMKESSYSPPSSREDAGIFDNSVSHVPEKYRGTSADMHDMSVLGKKQVLRVSEDAPISGGEITDLNSEISALSPCWVLPRHVSPVGKEFYRKSRLHR